MAEGIFGSLFGATGTGGDAPSTPTITYVLSGTTVTATFTGDDAGETNELRYRAMGATAWVDAGSRSGDGDIAVAGLTAGLAYEFIGWAANGNGNSEPAPGSIIAVPVTTMNIFDPMHVAAGESAMETMGESVVLHISDVDSRNVKAIVHRQTRESLSGASIGNSEPTKLTFRNDGTNGLTAAEVNRGTFSVSYAVRKGGSNVKKAIRDVISQNAGFVTVKVL